MGKQTFILSVISGVLLFLSFPKFDLNFLVWFSLVPLLYVLRNEPIREAFKIGFVTGFVYNVGIVYWVAFVVVQYGYLPLYIGVIVMLLLALYLSVYVALFSAGVVYLRERGFPEILVAPILWTCLEYGRSSLLTGFPWENIAYALHNSIYFIQIADITGIYGITFFIIFINCVLYQTAAIKVKEKGRVIAGLAWGVVLLFIVLGYGLYRLHWLEKDLAGVQTQNVAIIQGNIDQSIKWDEKFLTDTLNIYDTLSREMTKKGMDLIVWPETAAPFFFQNIDDSHRAVIRIARESKSYLLFGSPSYSYTEGRRFLLNSAYLISPTGKIVGRYDKTHLVPFGEYVPLRRLLFFVDKLIVGVGDFIPGGNLIPLAIGKERAGILICYEGIFPDISRKYRNGGATILVNITNDAWFGTSSAPYQHAAMTVFRAIENRVYIIRAANTGISAIISPGGEIISKTGLFERRALSGSFQYVKGATFYSKYGDIFIYLCFIALIGIFLISLKRRETNDRRYFRSN